MRLARVGKMPTTAARHERLGIAREVDPASLPRRTEERLADGGDEAAMGVADDQPDASQAALDEPPQERRPGIALVVAGRQLEAEDPTLAGARHPDRHEGGHADHPAAVTDLAVRRVEDLVEALGIA